ncbi:MAG: molecular chaperone DnaJ [Promethearchaeota archaeon]|jgi:molecular chaperone DnaJ
MAKRDYYEILGIERSASPEEIKKTYRRLAHKHHPDRNIGDEDAENRFKEVAEAYEILSDPESREQYDHFGHNAPKQGRGFNPFTDPFEMFNSFFGGRRQRRGRDLRIEITITLEEVLIGTEKDIKYARRVQCSDCKGLGGKGSSCKICAGYGQTEQQTSGYMRIITTCSVCQGTGVTITTKCSTCNGQGSTKETREINVNIPAGVQTGNQINITGEGDVTDLRYYPGNLLCIISVEPHALFQRKGQDIQYVQGITFVEACIGTVVKIPLLGGQETDLIIPPGTQFGQSFRLKGKGLPRFSRKQQGDQFVKIHINVPKNLTKEEQQLLQQFEEKIKDRA